MSKNQTTDPNSIHLICKSLPGGGFTGVHLVRKKSNLFRLEAYGLKDAETLVGGWVYLHQTKQSPSHLGGRIVRVEDSKILSVHGTPDTEIIFESRVEGKNQKWRGKTFRNDWQGGLVDADLEHERGE